MDEVSKGGLFVYRSLIDTKESPGDKASIDADVRTEFQSHLTHESTPTTPKSLHRVHLDIVQRSNGEQLVVLFDALPALERMRTLQALLDSDLSLRGFLAHARPAFASRLLVCLQCLVFDRILLAGSTGDDIDGLITRIVATFSLVRGSAENRWNWRFVRVFLTVFGRHKDALVRGLVNAIANQRPMEGSQEAAMACEALHQHSPALLEGLLDTLITQRSPPSTIIAITRHVLPPCNTHWLSKLFSSPGSDAPDHWVFKALREGNIGEDTLLELTDRLQSSVSTLDGGGLLHVSELLRLACVVIVAKLPPPPQRTDSNVTTETPSEDRSPRKRSRSRSDSLSIVDQAPKRVKRQYTFPHVPVALRIQACLTQLSERLRAEVGTAWALDDAQREALTCLVHQSVWATCLLSLILNDSSEEGTSSAVQGLIRYGDLAADLATRGVALTRPVHLHAVVSFRAARGQTDLLQQSLGRVLGIDSQWVSLAEVSDIVVTHCKQVCDRFPRDFVWAKAFSRFLVPSDLDLVHSKPGDSIDCMHLALAHPSVLELSRGQTSDVPNILKWLARTVSIDHSSTAPSCHPSLRQVIDAAVRIAPMELGTCVRFRDILSRHLGAPQVCLGTVASLYATLSLLAHARLVTAPYPSPLYEECIIGLDALPLRPVYRRLSSMIDQGDPDDGSLEWGALTLLETMCPHVCTCELRGKPDPFFTSTRLISLELADCSSALHTPQFTSSLTSPTHLFPLAITPATLADPSFSWSREAMKEVVMTTLIAEASCPTPLALAQTVQPLVVEAWHRLQPFLRYLFEECSMAAEALALWMVILQHHPSPQHVLLDSVIELLKGGRASLPTYPTMWRIALREPLILLNLPHAEAWCRRETCGLLLVITHTLLRISSLDTAIVAPAQALIQQVVFARSLLAVGDSLRCQSAPATTDDLAGHLIFQWIKFALEDTPLLSQCVAESPLGLCHRLALFRALPHLVMPSVSASPSLLTNTDPQVQFAALEICGAAESVRRSGEGESDPTVDDNLALLATSVVKSMASHLLGDARSIDHTEFVDRALQFLSLILAGHSDSTISRAFECFRNTPEGELLESLLSREGVQIAAAMPS